ncbi:MAG: hypothetical protein QG670_1559 [Thermoproteota archaeon]|nr:hypothetical protein [Thermoproteota archaeon]
MLDIIPLVGQQLLISLELRNLLWTIAILWVFSVFYRENPFYDFLEYAYIGVVTGWGAGANVVAIYNTDFVPVFVTGADPWRILVFVMGFSYFMVFAGRRFATIYRSIITMRLGAMLGTSLGTTMIVSMAAAAQLSATAARDPFAIIAVMVAVFTTLYFMFSKWTDDHFRLPRRIAYWIVFAYFAGFGVTMWMGRIEIMAGWVQRMATYPSIIIPFVALGIILLDVVFRRSRQTKTTQPIQPAK